MCVSVGAPHPHPTPPPRAFPPPFPQFLLMYDPAIGKKKGSSGGFYNQPGDGIMVSY